jgi:hypothetical protein
MRVAYPLFSEISFVAHEALDHVVARIAFDFDHPETSDATHNSTDQPNSLPTPTPTRTHDTHNATRT